MTLYSRSTTNYGKHQTLLHLMEIQFSFRFYCPQDLQCFSSNENTSSDKCEIFKPIICHTLPPINHWFISLFVTTVSFINTFCPSCANTDASSLFPLSSAQIHNSPAALARCCGCDCYEHVMDCNLPQLHKVTIPPGLLRSRDKCVLQDFWIEDVRHWIPPRVSFIILKWLTMLVV